MFLFLYNIYVYNVFLICFGQVECNLFPDIKNLYLRSVGPDESLVTNLINKAMDVFHKNTVGPKK